MSYPNPIHIFKKVVESVWGTIAPWLEQYVSNIVRLQWKSCVGGKEPKKLCNCKRSSKSPTEKGPQSLPAPVMWTRSPLLKSERPYNAPNVQNIRLQRPWGKRREAARDNTVLEKSQEYVCIVAPIKGWALREGGKSPKHHGIPRKDIRLWACSSGGQSLMSAWQHKLMSLPMWASW